MGILKPFLAVLLLLALQACTGRIRENKKQEETTATTAAVQPQPAAGILPSFAVLDASGNKLDIQTFKGKKVFVNLWATWCPPCRAEMPSIEKLYQASDKEKAQFVMLSLDNDFESAK